MTWMQTYTGRALDILDPKPEAIHLWDIAWALAHMCRYTGHTSEFYSVADHCLLVADIVRETDPELELEALAHDWEEAYVGDWSRPLKDCMRQVAPAVLNIPRGIKAAIGERFGLDLCNESPIVKMADTVALVTEARDLMSPPPRPWRVEWAGAEVKPRKAQVVPSTSPLKAAALLHFRAAKLLEVRGVSVYGP